MLELTIGNKVYRIEFTLEASLYNECTEKITGLMTDVALATEKNKIKEMIASMSNVPQTTLTLFYAGLLEHHGEDGDQTVMSKKDAKNLIKQYFSEHKEDGKDNFYDLMGILLDQMGKDGFFKQIGLVQMMEKAEEEETEKTQKSKKKTTKATEK